MDILYYPLVDQGSEYFPPLGCTTILQYDFEAEMNRSSWSLDA